MCGIAGFYSQNNKRPNVTIKQVKDLMLSLKSRGEDATGILWDTDNHYHWLKMPISADKFVKFVPWENIIKSKVCLIHCRHATQGNPDNNENNHPLINRPYALIHNGIIDNSDDFVSRNLTDSYAILESILDKPDKSKTVVANLKTSFKKLSGSATMAIFHMKTNRLYLVKHSNPLSMGMKGNTVLFASTSRILSKTKPHYITTVPDNYMLSIKNKDMKGYRVKFKEESYINTLFKSIDNEYDYTSWNAHKNYNWEGRV